MRWWRFLPRTARLAERLRAVRRHAAVRRQPGRGLRRGAHATPVQRLDLASRHPRLRLLPGLGPPRDARGGRRSRRRCTSTTLGWWVVAVNQLGSILFFLAGLAAFIRPATSSAINTGLVNWGTFAGAAVLRGRRRHPGIRHANFDKNGGAAHAMTTLSQSAAEALFGNRFLTETAPSTSFPQTGMRPADAMRLVGEDLTMEGDPQRNLATFVTTWMEPEAQRIIAENLHRNFIDHAEYPISAEIEQRCVRMLADLFHAPGETTGCRTQGSSEAIMLGALSLKWKWKERRQAAEPARRTGPTWCSAATSTSCGRSSAATSTSSRGSSRSRRTSTRSAPRTWSRTSTRTPSASSAVLGTTFTGHMDDIVGINELLLDIRNERDLDIPHPRGRRQRRVRVAVPLPRLRVGLPSRAGALDQRVRPQVRAGLPRHRLAGLPGGVRPRRGPGLLRELPRQDRRHVHAELLDRRRRWCWRSTTTSSAWAATATPT